MSELISQFEKRKQDHLDLALRIENEAIGQTGLSDIRLIHEALPNFNFSQVDISTESLGQILSTPFLVSSMTAGHSAALDLNSRLAKVCAERGWLMGVGSQRRELTDSEARNEWKNIRRHAANVRLLGNIGIAQLINTPTEKIKELVDALEATAMIVHLNALQECLQPEGTTDFSGSIEAIAKLTSELSVPVIVKETGCGFSTSTLNTLAETNVYAVDVSGFGGTHWGRIEGQRAAKGSVQSAMRETFKDWGISTVESLLNAKAVAAPYQIWASGGVRTGLDAAKCVAMGAQIVGFAKPVLEAALKGDEALNFYMETVESELKTALFCTGCKNLRELSDKKVWQWQTTST